MSRRSFFSPQWRAFRSAAVLNRPPPTTGTPRPAKPSSPGNSGIPWGQLFSTPVDELRIDEPRRGEERCTIGHKIVHAERGPFPRLAHCTR